MAACTFCSLSTCCSDAVTEHRPSSPTVALPSRRGVAEAEEWLPGVALPCVGKLV
jgi:hypothetical protein